MEQQITELKVRYELLSKDFDELKKEVSAVKEKTNIVENSNTALATKLSEMQKQLKTVSDDIKKWNWTIIGMFITILTAIILTAVNK
jgi:chromosome segregation ATPase